MRSLYHKSDVKFFIFVAVVIGMCVGIAIGISIRDYQAGRFDKEVIPATYIVERMEKVDSETTGDFFLRVNETINQYDERYIMHAFIPIFDVDSPTVVGVITTYRRK